MIDGRLKSLSTMVILSSFLNCFWPFTESYPILSIIRALELCQSSVILAVISPAGWMPLADFVWTSFDNFFSKIFSHFQEKT